MILSLFTPALTAGADRLIDHPWDAGGREQQSRGGSGCQDREQGTSVHPLEDQQEDGAFLFTRPERQHRLLSPPAEQEYGEVHEGT